MAKIITGTATFSSQANRDAAKTRMDEVLVGIPYAPVATTLINSLVGVALPDATTINISISVPSDMANAGQFMNAIYDAWIGTGGNARHTRGWIGSSTV